MGGGYAEVAIDWVEDSFQVPGSPGETVGSQEGSIRGGDFEDAAGIGIGGLVDTWDRCGDGHGLVDGAFITLEVSVKSRELDGVEARDSRMRGLCGATLSAEVGVPVTGVMTFRHGKLVM